MESIKIVNDYFIRYLFGSEKNNDILLSFVNAVLADKGHPPLASVRVTNPFQGPLQESLKESILDVRAIDGQGRVVTVEIQTCRQRNYVERALYYWAKAYAEQLGRGALYERLRPVIQINLLDFVLFPDSPLHSEFIILDRSQDRDLALSDHLQLHFIQMKKLAEALRAAADGNEPVSDHLREWLVFLKEGNTERYMQYIITDEYIRKAREEYDEFVQDPAQKAAYDAHEKWLRDYNSSIHDAREEGFADGRLDGLTEGREEGLIAGLHESKLEIARNMKASGMAIDTILRMTGLSEDEIRAL